MTDMSREQSRICSHGTSNSKVCKLLIKFCKNWLLDDLIERRVEVAFVYRSLLFLNLFLSKHQPNFHVRIFLTRLLIQTDNLSLLPDFPLISFAFRFLALKRELEGSFDDEIDNLDNAKGQSIVGREI